MKRKQWKGRAEGPGLRAGRSIRVARRKSGKPVWARWATASRHRSAISVRRRICPARLGRAVSALGDAPESLGSHLHGGVDVGIGVRSTHKARLVQGRRHIHASVEQTVEEAVEGG